MSYSRGEARGSSQGKQSRHRDFLGGRRRRTNHWPGSTGGSLHPFHRRCFQGLFGKGPVGKYLGESRRRVKWAVRESCWLSEVCSFQSFFSPYLGNVTTPLPGFFCYAPSLTITEPVIFQRRRRHLTRAKNRNLVPLNDFAFCSAAPTRWGLGWLLHASRRRIKQQSQDTSDCKHFNRVFILLFFFSFLPSLCLV